MTYPTLLQVRDLNRKLNPESFKLYRRILIRLCQDYSHVSFVRPMLPLIHEQRWDDLLSYADSLATQSYAAATDHFVANQFAALIRKYPFPKGVTSCDPKGKATITFLLAETRCKRINQRFVGRSNRNSRPGKRAPYEDILSKARAFVRYVIGERPDLSQVYSQCGFGPGANIGVHGNGTNAARKLLAHHWSVSPSALPYAYAACISHAQVREVLLPDHGGFSAGSPFEDRKAFMDKIRLVQHNKIVFVPKTARTDRSIAVEPLLNGFVQKGVDLVLRNMLKRVGIDLSDQTRNCTLAQNGSADSGDDPFCTIDLSSASDSISIGLCRDLLPTEWFDFLNSLRSKSYELDGAVHRYHKFVSMGNGFCFPLETLIFASLCHAVAPGAPGKDFLVYGDDIVCRRARAESLIPVLRYAGFRINADKTFLFGPFRESCGADFFGGSDVRPFTLDFALDSLSALFKFLNLTNRSHRTTGFFDGVRSLVLERIPRPLRFYRPFVGNADSGIDSLADEYLTTPSVTFSSRKRAWVWQELDARGVGDNHYLGCGKSGSAALVFAALSGSPSALPFAFRRLTKTKVRVVSHPGATSLWRPPLA